MGCTPLLLFCCTVHILQGALLPPTEKSLENTFCQPIKVANRIECTVIENDQHKHNTFFAECALFILLGLETLSMWMRLCKVGQVN